MKFIVTTYSPQDERFGGLTFFDSYKQARTFIAFCSGRKAKITKKYPLMPKQVIVKVMENQTTLHSAFPIVDLNWIGALDQVVDVFRISVTK